jgi:hypothetical protein
MHRAGQEAQSPSVVESRVIDQDWAAEIHDQRSGRLSTDPELDDFARRIGEWRQVEDGVTKELTVAGVDDFE